MSKGNRTGAVGSDPQLLLLWSHSAYCSLSLRSGSVDVHYDERRFVSQVAEALLKVRQVLSTAKQPALCDEVRHTICGMRAL